MEGFGQSIATEGSTLKVTDSSTEVNTKSRNDSEHVKIALGKVGERWGQQLADVFNRPPTVHVYSGTGLGLLFTQDVPPFQKTAG